MEVYVDVWEENIAVDDMDEALVKYALNLKLTEVDVAHEVHINGLEVFM
jgi:hypothetical protein